jgi:hypothetical protein
MGIVCAVRFFDAFDTGICGSQAGFFAFYMGTVGIIIALTMRHGLFTCFIDTSVAIMAIAVCFAQIDTGVSRASRFVAFFTIAV